MLTFRQFCETISHRPLRNEELKYRQLQKILNQKDQKTVVKFAVYCVEYCYDHVHDEVVKREIDKILQILHEWLVGNKEISAGQMASVEARIQDLQNVVNGQRSVDALFAARHALAAARPSSEHDTHSDNAVFYAINAAYSASDATGSGGVLPHFISVANSLLSTYDTHKKDKMSAFAHFVDKNPTVTAENMKQYEYELSVFFDFLQDEFGDEVIRPAVDRGGKPVVDNGLPVMELNLPMWMELRGSDSADLARKVIRNRNKRWILIYLRNLANG